MRNLARDTGLFYILAHQRNGLPGSRYLYVKRIYEDRQGNVRAKWTEQKHEAKAWATKEAAQRNAENFPSSAQVIETYR